MLEATSLPHVQGCVSALAIFRRTNGCCSGSKHAGISFVVGGLPAGGGSVLPGAKVVDANTEMSIRHTLETHAAGLPKSRSIAPASVYNAVSSDYASTKELKNAAPGPRPETGLVGKDSIKFSSKLRKPCISDSSYI